MQTLKTEFDKWSEIALQSLQLNIQKKLDSLFSYFILSFQNRPYKTIENLVNDHHIFYCFYIDEVAKMKLRNN